MKFELQRDEVNTGMEKKEQYVGHVFTIDTTNVTLK
jgi:hypothetical protein